MTLFNEIRKKCSRYILERTQHLDSFDDRVMIFLKKHYSAANNSLEQGLVSVLNAVFTQNRAVFCLTRDATRDLVKQDENNNLQGFNNNHYRPLIHMLCRGGLIERVLHDPNSRTLSIYQLIHPELLRLLDVDVSEQRKEVIDFVNKKKKNFQGGTPTSVFIDKEKADAANSGFEVASADSDLLFLETEADKIMKSWIKKHNIKDYNTRKTLNKEGVLEELLISFRGANVDLMSVRGLLPKIVALWVHKNKNTNLAAYDAVFAENVAIFNTIFKKVYNWDYCLANLPKEAVIIGEIENKLQKLVPEALYRKTVNSIYFQIVTFELQNSIDIFCEFYNTTWKQQEVDPNLSKNINILFKKMMELETEYYEKFSSAVPESQLLELENQFRKNNNF